MWPSSAWPLSTSTSRNGPAQSTWNSGRNGLARLTIISVRLFQGFLKKKLNFTSNSFKSYRWKLSTKVNFCFLRKCKKKGSVWTVPWYQWVRLTKHQWCYITKEINKNFSSFVKKYRYITKFQASIFSHYLNIGVSRKSLFEEYWRKTARPTKTMGRNGQGKPSWKFWPDRPGPIQFAKLAIYNPVNQPCRNEVSCNHPVGHLRDHLVPELFWPGKSLNFTLNADVQRAVGNQ